MALALFGRNLGFNIRNYVFQQCRTGYIVLLPEINPALSDQNPLFKSGLPDPEKLTKEKCVETVGKYLLDFEHCVREVEGQLIASKNSDGEEKTDIFETVVDPLEALGAPLDTSWGLVKTMYLADSKLMPAENYLALHDRAKRARALKYTSHYIYSAFKECDISKLTEEEHRIVTKFITEGKLNGLELDGEKKTLYIDISTKLAIERDKFRKKVDIGMNQFRHLIFDPEITKAFPENLLRDMAVNKEDPRKGPWVVSLSPSVYPLFMEHCPDRDLRWNAWLNFRQVCSQFSKPELQNSNTLEQIRSLRRDQAKVLGYKNYVEMSMETKMAGSEENVRKMLSLILRKAIQLQTKEFNDLQSFADAEGFDYDLMLWDVPYWQRKYKEVVYKWNEEKVREYFQLDKVLNGLLKLCSHLFNVRFEVSDTVQTWHPDVKFYNIFEGDASKPVAGLYFDPYAREGKIYGPESTGYMVGIRPGARAYGPLIPLAALVFNFVPPKEDKPCLLSFSAVDTLFRKFGSALQHLLSTVSYSEVSGQSNIEWDAVEVVSNVMSLWLNDQNVIKSISKHYTTGEPLPFNNIEAIRRHMYGLNLCTEIYLSMLDLEFYTKKDFWVALVKELWPEHFVIPYEKNDSHPCSFVSSVAGEYSAAYYIRIWSQMLATDAFTSFTNTPDVKSIGTRFRDTFLAFGGSCHPNEVFRRFQGRDPTPEAFLESIDKCILAPRT